MSAFPFKYLVGFTGVLHCAPIPWRAQSQLRRWSRESYRTIVDTVPNFLQNPYSAFPTGVVNPPVFESDRNSWPIHVRHTLSPPVSHRPIKPFFSCNRTTSCPLVRAQRPRQDRWAIRTLPHPNLDYWQAVCLILPPNSFFATGSTRRSPRPRS